MRGHTPAKNLIVAKFVTSDLVTHQPCIGIDGYTLGKSLMDVHFVRRRSASNQFSINIYVLILARDPSDARLVGELLQGEVHGGIMFGIHITQKIS